MNRTLKAGLACALTPFFTAAVASANSLQLSIAVRETGSTGALGENGGTVGSQIEWLSLDGRTLATDGQWQQFTWTIGEETVSPFTGNGQLDGDKGTFEHLRIRNHQGITDPLRVYIDGLTFTSPAEASYFQNFEGFAPGTNQVLFQVPNFSGSTAANVLTSPNTTRVVDERAQDGSNSLRLNMQFVDNSPTRWVRMTTFNAPGGIPNPIVSLLPGSTVSFWAMAEVDAVLQGWSLNGSGNWNDPDNWVNSAVPNTATTAPYSTSAIARFQEAISQPATVTVDQPVVINSMQFRSPQSYTIAGPETLYMRGAQFVVTAPISVIEGHHTISAPLRHHRTLDISVSEGQSLTITDLAVDLSDENQPPPSVGVAKNGAGTLTVNRLRLHNELQFNDIRGNATINGGILRISDDNQVNRVRLVSMPGGATPPGRLDLRNNHLIMDWEVGADNPFAISQARIANAYNNGAWDGTGITSSTAAADGKTLGIADNTVLGVSEFMGEPVDATSVLIRYTYGGDATLSGTVTIADLGILAANWQGTEKGWAQGDFNYDGSVNIADLGILAGNWQAGTSGGMSFDEALAMFDVFDGVVVPEPAALGLIGFGALGLLGRRRRR
jgi:hypothetical protein